VVHGVDIGMTFSNARDAMGGDTPTAHELAWRFSFAWIALARSGNLTMPASPSVSGHSSTS